MKIDLHLHADGSLPLETVRTLIEVNQEFLKENELELIKKPNWEEAIKKQISVGENCNSLEEYLKCFTLPLKLLQTPRDMYIAGIGIANELKKQNVTYAEIRFAPQLHSSGIPNSEKLSYEETIVLKFIEGVRLATRFSGTKINVLLCMMRNLDEGQKGLADNLRTLYLAKKFMNKGVVGLDLAGNEASNATSEFEAVFSLARDLEIPFTIHAGEAGDKSWREDSIERAIYFGAKRIGHGIALDDNKELMKLVRDSGIVVECCPISNVQTKAVLGGIKNHPIKRLLDAGIKVTVNTDNMTVSDTTLDKEYEVIKNIGITDSDIRKMQENAVEGAFISEREKSVLLRK